LILSLVTIHLALCLPLHQTWCTYSSWHSQMCLPNFCWQYVHWHQGLSW
jgi:hypothetical protein